MNTIVQLREYQTGDVRETRRFSTKERAEKFALFLSEKTALYATVLP